MAFKMKGPMFFSSALKNYRDTTKYKAFQGGNEAGSSLKHIVDDNAEHQETYGDDHSEDLQTEEEHVAGKVADERKSALKQAKTKGLGPRTAFGGVKNPELTKLKNDTNSKKVMNNGPKTQVTGVKNPGNWQPHPNTFKGQDHPDYRGNYDEVD